MPQSHGRVWLHIVFCTKERRPFLQDEVFRDEMYRMLSHHITAMMCLSASVGGDVDHVHLLVGLSRTLTIAQLVEHVKTETSKWAKRAERGVPQFRWQSGYGAFPVSQSLLDVVDHYIRTQADHHSSLSYQEEFRLLCERHGVEIDERYVWD